MTRNPAMQGVVDHKAEELVKLFADYVNNYGFAPENVVEFMKRQHRTLQQSMTEVMLHWFKHLASLNENDYDLRNEHSVKIAKMIRERLEKEWGGYWAKCPLI